MKIKGIIDEDFVNYKKPSMYIAFPNCSFKCDKYNGCQVCQNEPIAQMANIEINKETIIERYLDNPITQAFVLSGLEPFDSALDLISFISCVRNDYECDDDIVIYTGYTEEELSTGHYDGGSTEVLTDFYNFICMFPNIIIKFGRYIMNDESHLDPLLGVQLASKNQYAKKVSSDGIENQSKS